MISRPRNALFLAFLVAIFAAEPVAAQAPSPAPTPTPWYDEIALNGFVSVSYSYNTNRPDSRTNQYRVFDFDDNSFKIDVAELTFQKAATNPGEAGFRVDAEAGASIPPVSASYGLFQGEDFDLKQVFVTYVIPLGSGLRVDAGKTITHFNYEYIESWETPNDNATHSFTFGYAIPYTHTGLRASYAFSEQLAGMVMLANGWDNVKDNNSSKTVGGQVAWTPSRLLSVTGNFCTGPERTDVNSDPRTVWELVAQWKLSDRTVFGLDLVYGTERGAVVPGELATWTGIVGYARLGVSGLFALCLRGEYFADPEGARTGVSQKLKEVTLTPELKVSRHFMFRSDLRIDWSDRPVFEKKGGETSKTQPTVALNAIYMF